MRRLSPRRAATAQHARTWLAGEGQAVLVHVENLVHVAERDLVALLLVAAQLGRHGRPVRPCGAQLALPPATVPCPQLLRNRVDVSSMANGGSLAARPAQVAAKPPPRQRVLAPDKGERHDDQHEDRRAARRGQSKLPRKFLRERAAVRAQQGGEDEGYDEGGDAVADSGEHGNVQERASLLGRGRVFCQSSDAGVATRRGAPREILFSRDCVSGSCKILLEYTPRPSPFSFRFERPRKERRRKKETQHRAPRHTCSSEQIRGVLSS